MAGTVLTEICMGLGPCGELRYPAYQARWPPHIDTWFGSFRLHDNIFVLRFSTTRRVSCCRCRRREGSGATLGRRWARTGRSPCSAASQVRPVASGSAAALPAACHYCYVSMLLCAGIGEFQCYDRFILDSLRAAAEAAGHPEWCALQYSVPCSYSHHHDGFAKLAAHGTLTWVIKEGFSASAQLFQLVQGESAARWSR